MHSPICPSHYKYLSLVSIYLTNDSDVIASEHYTSFKNSAHLQHEDLARGLVDVKLALVWPVSVDALPSEEVHDVLWPVLVAICGRDLEIQNKMNETF